VDITKTKLQCASKKVETKAHRFRKRPIGLNDWPYDVKYHLLRAGGKTEVSMDEDDWIFLSVARLPTLLLPFQSFTARAGRKY